MKNCQTHAAHTKVAAPRLATLALTLTLAMTSAFAVTNAQASGTATPTATATTPATTANTTAAKKTPYDAKAWATLYPREYYSSLGSADHLDDPNDPNFGYGHGSQGKYMMKSIKAAKETGGQNATCFSCKTARFNDIYRAYGDEVFEGKKSPKYAEMLRIEDFWSCDTCHSDIKHPAASVGAQLMTPGIFGKELFEKLPPKTAACAQCHNNLSPWSDSRIVPAKKMMDAKKSAYRYGWDADALIKATLEDAVPTGVRYPEGKTYETSPAAHAKTDKALGIYLIANGNHADAEVFADSLHAKMGVTCADCHMPVVEDQQLGTYRSHDSSKSVLNSKASMQYCLTCHTNDKVKTVKDMTDYVRAAQADIAKRDAIVAEKLDQTFDRLKAAITSGKVDAKVIETAKRNYATASYYKEFIYGNRGATPGEKVAHNPQMNRELLEKAAKLLDDTMAMLP